MGHEHVSLLVVFVIAYLHYRLSVLSYRGSVEKPFVLARPAWRSLIVLQEVVVFVDRGGQVCARLPCVPWLVSSSSSLSARAHIPLTFRVDRCLDEVVAVGLVFCLALSVDGEVTRVQDVEGPAEEPSAVRSAWARLLWDLLGCASWLLSSTSCKYDALSHMLVDLWMVRRLSKMLSMR